MVSRARAPRLFAVPHYSVCHAQWECFLTDLWRRGLTGEHWDMICTDGGHGLLAALPLVYPRIPVQ